MNNKLVQTIASLALIAVLGFSVYSNSLNNQFIWDDYFLVKDNLHIRSWSNLGKIFSEDVGTGSGKKIGFYRPLQTLTYMLNYSFGKLNPKVYHLTNIALHISAAVAIYWFINTLFNNYTLSFLTSVLFVIHPIQTEAVDYISGRSDSLAAIFILLCLIAYIRYLKRRNIQAYMIMLSCGLAAFLSREISLILPCLLLLYHYTFKKELRIKELLPVFAISVLYLLLRFTLLKEFLPAKPSSTLLPRIPGFFVAITNYFRLLVAPFDLHMEYGKKLFSFTHPQAIIGLIILCSLIILVYLKRNNRVILFSVSWFLITLLPSSNLYPINAYMAEHWLYLPSIGFFLILAHSLSGIYTIKRLRGWALFFITGVLIAYSFLAFSQNEYWRQPLAFYKRTLQFAPDSARVYLNLGNTYGDMGMHQEAIAWHKKALAIDPFAEIYYNLGNTYAALGQDSEAVKYYKQSLKIKPNLTDAYFNLGLVYLKNHKHQEAKEVFEKAIEIKPGYAAAHYCLAVVYLHLKQYDLAIKHFDEAVRLGYQVGPDFLDKLKPYRR